MRRSLTCALILAVVLAAVPSHAAALARADDEADKLTPAEEREARSFVRALLKKVSAAEDPKPLMREMLAAGLPKMLRKEMRDQDTESLIVNLIESETAERASSDDLRAYIIAFSDFMVLFAQLDSFDKFERKHAGCKKATDKDDKSKFARLLPPDALDILRGDPALASIFLEKEYPVESDMSIGSVEQLRAFTSRLEQAASSTRAYLKDLPAWRHAASYLPDANGEDDSTSGDEFEFEITSLEEPFLGYPKGTRLICVKALMLHVDLLNVGGHLRLVAVSPEDYVIRTPEDRKEAEALAAMFEAIEKDDTATMTALLDAGLDVNAEGGECGMTALQHAALYGSDAAVKLLLARGADVNALNEYDNDALLYAAGRGQLDIVQTLLGAGVEKPAKDRALSAVSKQSAENYKEIARLLRMYGAVE